MTLVEIARAKVNLTLRVLGRRADRYHELDSLVAFADVGDVLTAEPSSEFELVCDDPGLAGPDNLIAKAATAWAAETGAAPQLRISLDKRLPVAGGIGGGSADAAAALWLFERASGSTLAPDRRHALARSLGADVPVCLRSVAVRMAGTGDILEPVAWPGPIAAVLVNPRCVVPPRKTADVFRQLAAKSLAAMPERTPITDVATAMRTGGNDLEAPAIALMPAISDVLAALRAAGAGVARLSGAGPTCFGTFEDHARAAAAAGAIAAAQPGWWIAATTLR